MFRFKRVPLIAYGQPTMGLLLYEFMAYGRSLESGTLSNDHDFLFPPLYDFTRELSASKLNLLHLEVVCTNELITRERLAVVRRLE